MSGMLRLIPTPIGDDIRLHPGTLELLQNAIATEQKCDPRYWTIINYGNWLYPTLFFDG